MRTRGCLLWAVGATLMLAPRARADEALPMLRSDLEIQCLADEKGLRWRVQCDEEKKVCLYAPDAELDGDGKRIRPLGRTARSCVVASGLFDRAALVTGGMKLVPARADAPYGWTRDERQRVFQVSFDLHKRIWLGASWSPTDAERRRFAFDVGLLELEAFIPGNGISGTRHRLRLGTGEVRLAPFSTSAVAFHYDVSRRYETPLIRITTFFGRPRRHDLDLSLGWWLEAGHLEIYPTGDGDEVLWRLGTVHITCDFWHSYDMSSYVRVRGGVGVERANRGETPARVAVAPGAALEAAVAVGRDGFHHLTAAAVWEEPRYLAPSELIGDGARRVRAELGYELIVLAINDQPVTLRLGGAAVHRDDVAPGWEYSATAGLRLSLWVPAPEPR